MGSLEVRRAEKPLIITLKTSMTFMAYRERDCKIKMILIVFG